VPTLGLPRSFITPWLKLVHREMENDFWSRQSSTQQHHQNKQKHNARKK